MYLIYLKRLDRKHRCNCDEASKHDQVNALTFKGAIIRITFGDGGRAISIYDGSYGERVINVTSGSVRAVPQSSWPIVSKLLPWTHTDYLLNLDLMLIPISTVEADDKILRVIHIRNSVFKNNKFSFLFTSDIWLN